MPYPTFSLSNPKQNPTLRFSGTLQGNPGGGRPCLDCALARTFSLRFADGTVFLSPLKVGQVPPLF
jgi:hypothetical protein